MRELVDYAGIDSIFNWCIYLKPLTKQIKDKKAPGLGSNENY